MTHQEVFQRYLDNVERYLDKYKFQEPEETFMREIENYMAIPEQGVDDFRRQCQFYPENPRLGKAIEKYLKNNNKRNQNIIDCYLRIK